MVSAATHRVRRGRLRICKLGGLLLRLLQLLVLRWGQAPVGERHQDRRLHPSVAVGAVLHAHHHGWVAIGPQPVVYLLDVLERTGSVLGRLAALVLAHPDSHDLRAGALAGRRTSSFRLLILGWSLGRHLLLHLVV